MKSHLSLSLSNNLFTALLYLSPSLSIPSSLFFLSHAFIVIQVCNLEAGDFIHVLGDAHVYSNHVEPLRVQLARAPRPFPKLTIDPSIKHIDQFKMEHFQLHGYDPHGKIEMEMAV